MGDSGCRHRGGRPRCVPRRVRMGRSGDPRYRVWRLCSCFGSAGAELGDSNTGKWRRAWEEHGARWGSWVRFQSPADRGAEGGLACGGQCRQSPAAPRGAYGAFSKRGQKECLAPGAAAVAAREPVGWTTQAELLGDGILAPRCRWSGGAALSSHTPPAASAGRALQDTPAST